MKTPLTLREIENMFQNGEISEFEFLVLLEKYIKLRRRAAGL